MRIILFAAFMAMITMTSNAQSAKFEWANKMGGTNNESGNAIAVDSAGNVYTAGNFTGTVTFDPLNIIIGSKGFTDVFITKHDASGAILWAKQIGGVSDDLLRGIAVSGDYVYITGNYNQTCDFDPAGSTTFNITSAGIGDIFVAKYETSSGGLVWAKSMGGASADLGFGIAADKSGNVYTTGNFAGACDFDPGAGSTLLGSAGSSDIFISKLDKDGNFEWAKTMGGIGADGGVSIATDLTGNVYFAGSFRDSFDFDPSASVLGLKSFGVGDGFIAKYNSMGLMQWTKQIGGTGNEYIEFITVDKWNNVIATGTYENGADFDPGTATFNLSGTGRIFVSKLNNNGSFLWAKKLGSLGSGERSKSVATDKFGSVYTVGDFSGTQDFDPNSGTANLTSVGVDVFISKLDSSGNYNGAYRFGGTSAEIGNGIASSQDGSIYTTGSFFDTCDFDPSAAIFNLVGSGGNDIFVHKLSQCLINKTTSLTGNTISANMNGVSYQWVNCATGFSIISGATSQSFTPTISGNYAVIIKNGTNCMDTSACVSVTISATTNGIDDNAVSNQIALYPNPAQNQVNLNNLPTAGNIKLVNILGHVVMDSKIINEQMSIDLSNFASDLYFIHISKNDSEYGVKKLFISK